MLRERMGMCDAKVLASQGCSFQVAMNNWYSGHMAEAFHDAGVLPAQECGVQ
jgi:hypothetical protein